MADLMADLSPWILAGFFGLVAWYMRQASKQHDALVHSIEVLVKEMRALEKGLDEQVRTVSRRFERYALATSERLASIEVQCAPVVRKRNNHSWAEDSGLGTGTN